MHVWSTLQSLRQLWNSGISIKHWQTVFACEILSPEGIQFWTDFQLRLLFLFPKKSLITFSKRHCQNLNRSWKRGKGSSRTPLIQQSIQRNRFSSSVMFSTPVKRVMTDCLRSNWTAYWTAKRVCWKRGADQPLQAPRLWNNGKAWIEAHLLFLFYIEDWLKIQVF